MEAPKNLVRQDYEAPRFIREQGSSRDVAFCASCRPPRIAATVHFGTRLIELDRQAGTARSRFDAKPECANMLGDVQGGFIAAMIDDGAGLTVRLVAEDGLVVPTLDFRVSCLAPVRFGPVSAVERCLRAGKRIAFIVADLIGDEGIPLNRMSATALTVR